MRIMLSVLGVAFVAFCVWLTVRIINRREVRIKDDRILVDLRTVPEAADATLLDALRAALRVTPPTGSS